MFTPTGEETVLSTWCIRVQRATFVDPEGVTFERDIVRHPGAVAVVAVGVVLAAIPYFWRL